MSLSLKQMWDNYWNSGTMRPVGAILGENAQFLPQFSTDAKTSGYLKEEQMNQANEARVEKIAQKKAEISENGGLTEEAKSGYDYNTATMDWLSPLIADIQRAQNEATSSANIWAEQQAEKANQFAHDEAALNRQWQEQMSNTAYQREVKDLEAAGLNKILAYSNGGGASTPSGSVASATSAHTYKSSVDTTDLAKAVIAAVASMTTNASTNLTGLIKLLF